MRSVIALCLSITLEIIALAEPPRPPGWLPIPPGRLDSVPVLLVVEAALPPVKKEPVKMESQPARLEVTLPVDAELWIDDQQTAKRGFFRNFVSPPINVPSVYRVKVRWRGMIQERTVDVFPGRTSTVEIAFEGYLTNRAVLNDAPQRLFSESAICVGGG